LLPSCVLKDLEVPCVCCHNHPDLLYIPKVFDCKNLQSVGDLGVGKKHVVNDLVRVVVKRIELVNSDLVIYWNRKKRAYIENPCRQALFL
jgi:hypothetical protein